MYLFTQEKESHYSERRSDKEYDRLMMNERVNMSFFANVYI